MQVLSRRAPRYRIEISATAQPLLGGELAVCRTRDVSELGLSLDTPAWFPLGTRLAVSLVDPASGGAMEIIGDVVREAIAPTWSLGIALIEPPLEWHALVASAARHSVTGIEKATKRFRVLVVGDDHRQRGAMALYVTSGWDVLFATDGESVAEAIEHVELDAVIAELDGEDPRVTPIMEGIPPAPAQGAAHRPRQRQGQLRARPPVRRARLGTRGAARRDHRRHPREQRTMRPRYFAALILGLTLCAASARALAQDADDDDTEQPEKKPEGPSTLKTLGAFGLTIVGLVIVMIPAAKTFSSSYSYAQARLMITNLLRSNPNQAEMMAKRMEGTFCEAIAAALKIGGTTGSQDPKVVASATAPTYDGTATGISARWKGDMSKAKLGLMAAAGGAIIGLTGGALPAIPVIIAVLAVLAFVRIVWFKNELDSNILRARAEMPPRGGSRDRERQVRHAATAPVESELATGTRSGGRPRAGRCSPSASRGPP